MNKISFNVRPIDIRDDIESIVAEPISVTEDLSGKMTLSSKYVAVNLSEIVDIAKTKDISAIIKSQEEEVIIPTNTFLKFARSKDLEQEDEKKFWIFYFFLGSIFSFILTLFFYNSPKVLLIVIVVSVTIISFFSGFIAKVFYEKKLKKAIQKWAEDILKDS